MMSRIFAFHPLGEESGRGLGGRGCPSPFTHEKTPRSGGAFSDDYFFAFCFRFIAAIRLAAALNAVSVSGYAYPRRFRSSALGV
jgi:hypothetical protein